MTSFASAASRVLLAGVLALLCLAPVLYGYTALLDSPESFNAVFSAAAMTRLVRSLLCAMCIAAVATVIGVLLGLSWTSRRGLLHSTIVALSIAPLVLPPYVYALAWIEIVGAGRFLAPGNATPTISLYSVSGVVLVESLRFAPVAAATVWLALRFTAPSLVEASLLYRGRLSTLVSIVIPARLPVLLAAPLLTFVLAFSNYSVASLLQVDLYPIDIQTQFSAHYDPAGAFALTLPILLVAAIAVVIWRGATKRSAVISDIDEPNSAGPIPLLSGRMANFCIGAFVAIAVAAPLAVVLVRTASTRAVFEASRNLSDETQLSVMIALICTAFALPLAVAIATLFRGRTLPTAIASVPLLVTGPAFGIGAILLWNHADWRGTVYDSTAILILTGMARVLAVGIVGAAIGLSMQPRDLDHAAELAGRSPLSRLLNITLPLAAPAVLLAAALMALFSFADADTAAIVAPPGSTPLAVRIAGLLHYGPSDFIHAASLLSGAVALITIAFTGLAMRLVSARIS